MTATSSSFKKRPGEDGTISPPPLKRKQQSSTTQKAVANFFKPASQKEPERMAWRVINESLLVGRYQASKSLKLGAKRRKVAAFDFDSTLIKPASGNRFGKDAEDWKWWHGSVPGTLKKLHEDGYIVTILSNQAGLSLKTDTKTVKGDIKRLSDFKAKTGNVLAQLDLPISIYAATAKDHFRKPRTGMWSVFLEEHDMAASDVDLENSIFVGDAGGRPGTKKGAHKDHSCSDRNFAANIGIPFKTPEEYFLNEPPEPFVRDFEPGEFVNSADAASPDAGPIEFKKTNPTDIVLFCGSPGAGKSTFYWTYLQPLGYERINQDILKTRDKCLKAAAACLEKGVSVVIDNTNADPDTRAHWVNLARRFEVPIRCVLFTVSPKLCEHNDTVRALNQDRSTLNPERRTLLPRMAFTGFAARYRAPRLEEGFQDVVSVGFRFEGDEEQKRIWGRYWL